MNLLNSVVASPVAHTEKRQLKELKNIVRYLSKSETSLTIPEIAVGVKISVPTTTKHVRDLVDKEYYTAPLEPDHFVE